MNERIKNLQERYRTVLGEADAIRKQYAGTADPMSDEDEAKFDRAIEESEKLASAIEKEQKAFQRDLERSEPVQTILHPAGKGGDKAEIERKQMDAFNEFLRFGWAEGKFNTMQAELKTLQADLDVSGGYLLTPQVFVTQLLKNVDDLVVIRRMATKFPLLTGESLGVPSLDTDLDDADWTTELATGSQDDATRFGKRELRPHPFAKRVKVSNKLLRQAILDPEAHVRERMAYKFGLTEEKGFLTGSGSGRPLGVFTASAQGISTGRDVSTGMTTTSITADGLIEVKHTLKPQYWPQARWLFHRDAVKQIRKLKDGNGQYLWQPGIQGGVPNTILDTPYEMSEYAPNTFTTAQYVGIIGDFRFYWIADALNLTIQRVVELYAEQDATGFIGRAEADGMPVLEEAFVRAKLA